MVPRFARDAHGAGPHVTVEHESPRGVIVVAARHLPADFFGRSGTYLEPSLKRRLGSKQSRCAPRRGQPAGCTDERSAPTVSGGPNQEGPA